MYYIICRNWVFGDMEIVRAFRHRWQARLYALCIWDQRFTVHYTIERAGG